MVGSTAHGCFANCHGLRRENNKKYVQHNHGQKIRIALLMNYVKAGMFLGSADTTTDEGTPGQAGLVTARFVLRQLLFFFFLAEVPH